jgi:hypothetical protein
LCLFPRLFSAIFEQPLPDTFQLIRSPVQHKYIIGLEYELRITRGHGPSMPLHHCDHHASPEIEATQARAYRR